MPGVLVKTDTKDPVPPLTLAQAGLACVCRSAAWNAKMVTSAYWVHPEQVSKSAPTGEYLSTGTQCWWLVFRLQDIGARLERLEEER